MPKINSRKTKRKLKVKKMSVCFVAFPSNVALGETSPILSPKVLVYVMKDIHVLFFFSNICSIFPVACDRHRAIPSEAQIKCLL